MAIKPLLIDSMTNNEWESKRRTIKDSFYSIIGHSPIERNTRDITIICKEDVGDYTRLSITYVVGEGEVIPAYLLVPNNKQEKYPAIVAMHQFQDSDIGKKEPAGICGHKDLCIGHEMALRGYVVLIPDYLTAGERVGEGELFNSNQFYAQYPNWSMIGKNFEDSMAAIDVLVSLNYVDDNNIGVIGHSLGGHNAMISFALDDRIKVGVSNCGFSVLSEEEYVMEWVDDTYNFMPKMKQYIIEKKELPFDLHELAALICPKPWLNISAYQDDAYGNQQFLSQVGNMLYSVYELYNATDNFAYIMHGNNHRYPKHLRDLSYSWIDRYLK